MFGLNEVFKGEKPDLVVSGTNVGSNVGFDTNYSGTVGAAIVASGAYGVPAIAISTDTSYRESEVVPAYAQTAELLVEILDRGIPSMDEGTILNINYPLLKDGEAEAKGLKYAPMSSRRPRPSRTGRSTTPPRDRARTRGGAARIRHRLRRVGRRVRHVHSLERRPFGSGVGHVGRRRPHRVAGLIGFRRSCEFPLVHDPRKPA